MNANTLISAEAIASDAALEAARVCVWDWNEETSRLRIRARGDSSIPDVEGDWRLDDFVSVLDGLSASAMRAVFSAPGQIQKVETTIRLASGRELRLLGAHDGNGHAKGLLFGANIISNLLTTSAIEAVFQPIIRLSDGSVAGFEALARWRGDDGQIRRASDLDDSGLAMAGAGLALEMLNQAGAALAEWQAAYPEMKLFLQVNLTGSDLFRADVIARVHDLVGSGRLAAGSLKLELTEQMALRDFDAGVAAAAALQASGAAIVLDDFGSGHSSLAWLASIPATGIKIDPQLTQMLGEPRIDTILAGIMAIAAQLGMTVTAEGIEDLSRVAFLRDIGCDYGQGFAYAYPMLKSDADKFLAERPILSI